MPKYTVTHPETGRKITLTGTAPPSEAELDDIFAQTAGDVLGRTPSYDNRVTDKAEIERRRREYVAREGTAGTKLKEGAKVVRDAAMPYVRPLLEGGGAAAGSILGAGAGGLAGLAGGPAAPGTVPYGAIAGGVAGGATGYATGKYLADALEGRPQSAPQTLRDLGTGAMYEMGGQGAAMLGGKAISAGANAYRTAKGTVSRSTPALTQGAVNRKAGEIIAENSGQGAVYEKNAADAARVNIPGYKPSLGETRNDPGLIKLQRSIERQPGTAGNTILEQKAANQAAVKDYLENEFTGNESIDDVINALNQKKAQIGATTAQAEKGAESARGALNPADSQTVGRGIASEIEDAITPVKAAEREAWAKVPNYPIPTTNLDEVADRLVLTPMVKSTESAVNEVIDFARRMPKTTEGLQSVERTINDKMYAANVDPDVRRVLGQLKKAINDDFKLMGEAADAGDVALHQGKIVMPSKIKSDLATIEARIAEEETKTAVMDVDAMRAELMSKGIPAMKQMAETPKAYADRLAKDYERAFKKSPPTVQGESKAMGDLVARRDALASQLNELQPAEDVATAYRAAKDVSKERFDRFGKGTVSEVTKQGNQTTGLKLPDNMIPAKVFTPQGADDFIRAVGKDKAAVHADQYAAQDLLSKANPLTGEIPAKTVAAWIQKNMLVLRKYGISGKYTTVAKAQAQAEIARAAEVEFTKSAASRILNSDVDKAISSAFSSNPSNTGAVIDGLIKAIGTDKQGQKGLQNAFKDFLVGKVETTAKTISGDAIISPAAIQKELVKYAPALRRLYANDPGKIAALQKVSKAVEIQSRSARSPIGGGSDTAENLNVAQSILGRVVDIIPGGGFVRGMARVGLGKLNDLTAQEVNKVIARALYDPELARTLIMASKRAKPQLIEKRLNSHLITMGLIATRDNDQKGE